MAFLSAWAGGYLYYSSVKNSAFEEAKRQAVFHAETIRNHLSSFLFENLNSVRALAGLGELSEALKIRDELTLVKANVLLDHFKNAYQVDVCYLIDHEGNTIASSNRDASDSFIGQNYAFRPYFQSAMNGAPVFSSGYMALGVTSAKRGVYYGYPVYGDSPDRPAGVAVIKAPIDQMEKEFVQAYEGIVMLTDPHGIVFFSNRTELVLNTVSKLSSEEIDQIREYKQFGEGPWEWTGFSLAAANHAVDSSGNNYIFYKLAIDNYPGWSLIYLSDMESILKKVSGPIIGISSYLILTWCLFVGLAVFVLYGKANLEINQRKKAEKALRDAHDDLEKRVEDRTFDLAGTVDELRKEIAERKRVENALRESEEQYRTLTDNLSVGVFRTTPGSKGDIMKVNPAFTRMFGFDNREKMLLSHAYDLYQNPFDRERFSKKMLRDGAVINEEIMFRKKDGTPFIGSVTAVAVKSDSGEIRFYDGIIEDITELRQAEEESRKRREELAHLGRVATMGELAASLAHELNQPLTAILINAQTAIRIIKGNSPDLAEVGDILEDIISDDRRAGEVIKRLRCLFKKGKMEMLAVDMNSLVKEVVSIVNSEVIFRGTSIKLILDHGIPMIFGDRIHLQQVIINFILNASEAMENIDGAIREIIISTGRENQNRVKVGVSDSGVGIDTENFNRLLEPFYTTKPSGMGMGLSINRSIIEAHAGSLWAENNTDRGVTFYFTLPVHEED